jgi:hypothetical protein
MGTYGACSLLFCAAKRSGAFPPNITAGLKAHVSRLGGFTVSRGRSPGNIFPHQLGPGSLFLHTQFEYFMHMTNYFFRLRSLVFSARRKDALLSGVLTCARAKFLGCALKNSSRQREPPSIWALFQQHYLIRPKG